MRMKKALRFGSTTIHLETSALKNDIVIASARSTKAIEMSVGVAIFDGSRHETINNNGSRHFLEHLVNTKGSVTMRGYKIAKHIEQNGGIMSAETSQDDTLHYVTCRSWAKARDFFLRIASAIIKPGFTQDDVELERNVVIAEIKRDLDSHQECAYLIMMQLLFPNTTTNLP